MSGGAAALAIDVDETLAAYERQAAERRARRAVAARAEKNLTDLEVEIIHWVSLGKTSLDVATIMGGNETTVQKRIERIMAKVGVETRGALVGWSLRNAVIE